MKNAAGGKPLVGPSVSTGSCSVKRCPASVTAAGQAKLSLAPEPVVFNAVTVRRRVDVEIRRYSRRRLVDQGFVSYFPLVTG